MGATQTLRDRLQEESADKIIQLQKQEIRKLRTEVRGLEHATIRRPTSGERLPPLEQVKLATFVVLFFL